MSKKNPS
jgi:hypothetical protein